MVSPWIGVMFLTKKSLRYFRDIWDPGRNDFLGWDEERMKFSLVEVYHDLWVKLLELYGPFRERMLNQLGTQPTS